jgi:poly-gamma-glutamate synthesis protein (capsule biosynthesis protein)
MMKKVKTVAGTITGIALLATLMGCSVMESHSSAESATPSPSPVPKTYTVELKAVGDLMMHSPQITAGQFGNRYDFSSFFKYIAPTLAKGDLVLGNLETPMAGPATGYTGYPMFNSPDAYADAIKAAGFDVVTTANNHALDRREAGLLRTIQVLDRVGLGHTGTFGSADARNTPLLVTKNHIQFGILAYTYGTNGMPIPAGKPYEINLIDPALMQRDVAAARKAGAEVVVVCVHFGTEYQRHPNDYQKRVVDGLFAAGADIILGSHPHVVQPYQVRTIKHADGTSRTGVVIYSLGNFISNQRDNPTDIGGILNVRVVKKAGAISLDHVSFNPTYVHRYVSGGRRVYNVVPMAQVLRERNYPPFGARDYATLQARYTEMMRHVVSAP